MPITRKEQKRRASKKTDVSFFHEGAELDEIASNEGGNSAVTKGEPKRTRKDYEDLSGSDDVDDKASRSSLVAEKDPRLQEPLSPLNSDEESICRHHGIGKMQPMRTILKQFSPMSDLDSDTERKIAAIIAVGKGKKHGLKALGGKESNEAPLISMLADIKEEQIAPLLANKSSGSFTSASAGSSVSVEGAPSLPARSAIKSSSSSASASAGRSLSLEGASSMSVRSLSQTTGSVVGSNGSAMSLSSGLQANKASRSGIQTIEECIVSTIKIEKNFSAADFDAFKTITEPLPTPKFHLLGRAELEELGMEPTSSLTASTSVKGVDNRHDHEEMDSVSQNSRQDTIESGLSDCLRLVKPFSKEGKYTATNSVKVDVDQAEGAAYLTFKTYPVAVSATSMLFSIKVVVDFNSCFSGSGKKSSNGPELKFSYAVHNSVTNAWDKLPITCSITDKRGHFSIESLFFAGLPSDRTKYGPAILNAVYLFLRDIYTCPDYPPPKEIRWDLQTLESEVLCLFEPTVTVRRELANNSKVLEFLRHSFLDAGHGAFLKKLETE